MTNPMIAQELDALVVKLRAHDPECSYSTYDDAADQITALRGEVDTLRAERDGLLAALEIMTKHYVQLANCGDCGFWDPEAEDEVIQARAAILAAVGGTERAKEEPKP